MTRFWFFGDGERVLIASADCQDLRSAQRLADAYNVDPGRTGPLIDLIASGADPTGNNVVRVPVKPPPPIGDGGGR